MADHGEVKLRQKRINSLVDVYKSAYISLTEEIITATEAGKINKARTMARIRKTLTELGVDVNEWVKKEIPQYYLDGANQALQDLRRDGIDIHSSGITAINKEAIKSLVEDTSIAFNQGLTGIAKNAQTLLGDALKQQINFTIAEGKLKGEARKTITNSVKDKLKESGLAGITDRAGRNWQFDTYAEMLVRTKAVESRNAGLAGKMIQNGYDLVQVSNHNSSHAACAEWEGQILSLTGKTPDYPTLDEAEASGLFHPNCQHAINVIEPDLAEETEAYDNPFNKEDFYY